MDLSISQMMQFQKELYERNKETWSPMEPEYGKDSILFMIEEIGEVIAIIKKKGSTSIVSDREIRANFLEEMADVLMYYHDALLRFHVTPEEISEAYFKKHSKNTKRNYIEEYKELYHNG